jgi:hypothetical protein
MSFPSSIDSFTGFTSGETLQAASHAAQSNQEQTAIVAVETKVGTGASTPTANNVLVGNGVGTSTWGQVGLSTGVSGILPVTSGGTGTGTSTGTGSVVLKSAPTTNNETATNLTSTKLNNSSGLTNTGGATTDTQTITGNATVGGTLGVTGAITGAGYSVGTISNPYKFSVYLANAQNSTTGTSKVLLDTKIFDTGNNFDAVTNHRFVAPIAGFYQFNWGVQAAGATTSTWVSYLYVNNAGARQGSYGGSATSFAISRGGELLSLSANDYVEIFLSAGGTNAIALGVISTIFSGFLVSAT